MFKIELTEFETQHFNTIKQLLPILNSDNWPQLCVAQVQLFQSIAGRKGFPVHRIEWFQNPSFNPGGRGKSRRKQFEENGTFGPEIIEHPHFTKYLNYFILGPFLPLPLMEEYSAFSKSLQPITSGDIEPLRKEARRLIRSYDLSSTEADEFYKLCLEIDIPEMYAESIRRAVLEVR